MKLIRKICILAALVGALAVTVSAQEVNLKVSNATAKKGETIYLTLQFTQPVSGNTVSVKYSYDDKQLKPKVDSCDWVLSGGIENFNKANSIGVWSCEKSTDLKGGLCILAFELKDGANFKKTQVTCEVKVKEGSKSVGTYTATSVITMDCAHQYGSWKDAGNLGHVQTCTLCQGERYQTHTWDQGKETQTKDPGKVEMLYTCTVCGGTKTVTQNKEQEIFPTFSKPTEENEDQPTQKPTQQQGPLTPTQKPDPDIPELTDPPHGKPTESTAGHDHGDDSTKSTVPSHNHDHDPVTQPQNEANPVLTGAVITVAVAAMVTGAILLVKKKK